MIQSQAIYDPLYLDKDKFIILVTGGRASGKSFNVATFIERLTFELNKLENGDRVNHSILYTRYTMVSASISVIPEFMEKVEKDGTQKYFRSTKTDIVNRMTGSHIMFRGIHTSSGNQTAKLKSIHGVTTFVCDEAEEWVSETDYEKIMLSIRQKGIQNRIIIIMNPTDSNHFIYQKYIKDTHKFVEYDGVPVQISTHPNVLHIHTTYLDNLDHLSEQFLAEVNAMKENDPDKYAHVVMGRWADVAEGAVFKKWGIVDEFPTNCKRVACGVDFGYTNDPTAVVKCGVVDNRLYIDEVCYKNGMLSSDIAKVLKEQGLRTIADSADPRLIDEIGLKGVVIYPVLKGAGSILAGIDKMKDMEIFVTKRSVNLQNELRNYVWAKDKDGNYINEPIDEYNHCFTGDTLITTSEGQKRIDEVVEGDRVLTSQGFQNVRHLWVNGRKKILRIRLDFGNFTVEINGTPDHKIKTEKGWKQLKDLTKGDLLYVCRYSTERNTASTKENVISHEAHTDCTGMYGNITKDQSQTDMMSTTRTASQPTTGLRTLSLLTSIRTWLNTCVSAFRKKESARKCGQTWTMHEKLLQSGIVRRKDVNGTESMQSESLRTCKNNSSSVNTAERSSQPSRAEFTTTAPTSARREQGITQGSTMKPEYANCVETSMSPTNIAEPASARAAVVQPTVQGIELKGIEILREDTADVYDLTVENVHEYFANGILVHNCIDAARYYVLGELLGKVIIKKNYKKSDLGIY